MAVATLSNIPFHAEELISRYLLICHRSRPKNLTTQEWCACFDVLNGVFFDQHSIDGIYAEIEDAEDGIGEKWGIDAKELAQKLRGMTFAEKAAVAEYSEQFWKLSNLSTEDALKTIGITP